MKHLSITSCIIIILIAFGCKKSDPAITPSPPTGEFLNDWTFHVNPVSGSNFTTAEFRLWIPDSIEITDLKALLVLSNHFNSNGLTLANSPEWQNYAKNNNLGILAIYLESSDTTTFYPEAAKGSGQALITALDSITYKNNIEQVADLPFLMRGYSGGGMFSYYFSAFKPERVAAFANIRGGYLWANPEVAKDIPALMLIADMDSPQNIEGIKTSVKQNRTLNGIWGYATEPSADHFTSRSKSDDLIKLFFTSVLRQRIASGTNELLPISPNSGFLGNNKTNVFFPFNDFPDDKTEASWLIEEEFGNAWKAYQTD